MTTFQIKFIVLKQSSITLTTILICLSSINSFSQDNVSFLGQKNSEKSVSIPPIQMTTPPIEPSLNNVTINANKVIANLSAYLNGNNSNPYMSSIISEPVLMEHLKDLSPKILRFPGGNLSNVYFWNALPNTKPFDVPDTILYGDNEIKERQHFWVGKDEKANSLSLNKYYELLQQIGAKGIICVNAGYARYGSSKNPIAIAAHYAADWVRFDHGRTRFWEIGNEDYGKWQAGYKIDTLHNQDEQPEFTNGELYGKIFKAFSDSMHQAAKEIKTTIEVGASLIEGTRKNKWDNKIEREWDSSFFVSAKDAADFFIIHNYYTPYTKNISADSILNTASSGTATAMNYMLEVTRKAKVAMKPVALTEWNIFSEGSKQQTSYISGMHAAIVLGELAKNNYAIACRWNLANGYNKGNDHGMFNKGDEPNMPKWSARPVFYYMYYFNRYFGNKMVEAFSDDNKTIIYASIFSDNKKGLMLINKDTTEKIVTINLKGAKQKGKYFGYTLTGGKDNGEFSQKVIINGIETDLPSGGPESFKNIMAWSSAYTKNFKIKLPPRSVDYILVNNE